MHILHLECSSEDKDRLVAELWERGTLGILEEDLPGGGCRLEASFEHLIDTTALAPYRPRWDIDEARDWVQVAQSQWEPLLVGSRFFLVPAWRGDPAPPGRLRLEMHPGRACGTGWAVPTQLALEGLERCATPGAAFLDVGTGSGILAVGAALLGAGPIYACDIDPEAAEVARERFRHERLAAGLFIGSVRSVRAASIDMLAANLNAAALVELAPDILRVLKPGGAAVLSGFRGRHLQRVEQAFPPAIDKLERDGWITLITSCPA